MRAIRAFLLALTLWAGLAAGPGFAASITQISGTGTNGAIANVAFNGGSSLSLTTTATIPPGSEIIIPVGGTATDFSASDPVNGSYGAGQPININSTASVKILSIYTTGSLASGSTITVSGTGVSGGLLASAFAFSFTANVPFDSASTTQVGSASGTATVGPTGTLNGPCGTSGCELLIGAVFRKTSSTLTNDTNFTSMGQGNGSSAFAAGFKIVNANTPVSYVPSWSGASVWAGQIQGFKAAAAATAKPRFRAIP